MRLTQRLDAARRRVWPAGELARNSVWALSSAAVVTLAVFAETIILARYLGPQQLGVLLLVLAYPEALQQLLDFRLRDAMTKYLAEFMANERHAEAAALIKFLWLIDVAVSAAAMLIVVATAGIVASLLVPDVDVAYLMRIYAIGVFLSSLDSASGSVLRVMDRFRLAFGTGATAYAGRLGFVIAAVALGGGLEALIWARVGGELLLALLQLAAALAVLRAPLWTHRRAPISLLRDRSREIRNFLLNTNFTGVVRLASTKLDTLLVGILASPSTVSIYKIALQFSKAPLLISDALNLAVFPIFARDYAQGHIRRMRETARRASIYITALALPITLVVAVFGDQIIAAFVGAAFSSAGTPLLLCLAGVVPYVCCFWLYPLLLTTGHARAFLRIVSVGTVIQVVLIVTLVPPFGASGAAAGFGLNYIVVVVLGLRFVHRRRLLGDYA